MYDKEKNRVSVGHTADLRSVLSWQKEQYRHIQILSQGFLASSLTILAVVATVFTALGNPIPEIPIPEASQGPAYVGSIATTIIIGFANFIWFILGTWAVLMFLVSLWKFVGLILERPLVSEKELADTMIVGKVNSDSEILGIDNLSSLYPNLIQQNKRDLEILRKRFRFAGFRFPGSLLIAIGAVELYIFAAGNEIIGIVLISLLFTLPSLSEVILNRFTGSPEDRDDITAREITLFQEFKLGEEHELSRWNEISQFWWEKGMMIVISALSTIIIITFVISYFI